LAEAFSFWLAFLAFAYPLFLRLKKNIEQRHFEILKTKSTALLINQAHQLAHDIRSPLVTLEMAMNDANSLPEEQRLLVQTATVRIRDIANDLLNRHKTGVPSQEETPSLYSIEFLLDQIVAEKRAQFRNRPEVEIEASMPGQIQPSLARLSASDFGRVLSNLINNAIEATKEGTIRVALISNADNSIISIQDSGCGIPSEVLKQLGSHKISHGKTGQESGSGLGVLHAKNCVESWGGNFRH
jgi:signal transduction histidine kinase